MHYNFIEDVLKCILEVIRIVMKSRLNEQLTEKLLR